jgi:hypothetical protein
MNPVFTFLDPVKALIEMVSGSFGSVMAPSAPAFSLVYGLMDPAMLGIQLGVGQILSMLGF